MTCRLSPLAKQLQANNLSAAGRSSSKTARLVGTQQISGLTPATTSTLIQLEAKLRRNRHADDVTPAIKPPHSLLQPAKHGLSFSASRWLSDHKDPGDFERVQSIGNWRAVFARCVKVCALLVVFLTPYSLFVRWITVTLCSGPGPNGCPLASQRESSCDHGNLLSPSSQDELKCL